MKYLLFMIAIEFVFCFNTGYAQQTLSFEKSADLNNDGKVEKIVLTGTTNEYGFTLNISGVEIKASFNDGVPEGIDIIDIAESDKYKEVLVQSPGASDDYEYFIYWYDGKEIHGIDHPFTYTQPSFRGNGYVYVGYWAGFYNRIVKYQYDPSSRSFSEIPQYAYFVGIKVNVLKPFAIYADDSLKQKVAMLGKDSEIEIILDRYNNGECGFKGNLFLIKSVNGLIGWVKEEGITEYLQLPSAG